MSDKAVITCSFLSDSVSDWDKSQEFCNDAVDNFLAALKSYFWLVCYK